MNYSLVSILCVCPLEAYEALGLFNKELLTPARYQGCTNYDTDLGFKDLVSYIILSAYFTELL